VRNSSYQTARDAHAKYIAKTRMTQVYKQMARNLRIGACMFKVLLYLAKNVEVNDFFRDLAKEFEESQAWVAKKMRRPKGIYRLHRPAKQKRFSDVHVDLMKLGERGEPFTILHEDEKVSITYPGFSFPQVIALVKGPNSNKEAIVCGYLVNHVLRKVRHDVNGLVIS